MRVFLLDGGTMMIDRSQLLWNVDCGVRLRFPIYSVLVEHEDGLFLFDTGIRSRARQPHLPQGGAAAERGAGHRRAARAVRLRPGRRHVHRRIRTCTSTTWAATVTSPAPRRSSRRPSCGRRRCPETFERYAYSDQSFDHPQATFELLEGDVELAAGLRLFETPGPLGRALLAAGRAAVGRGAALRVRRRLRPREPRPPDPIRLPPRSDGGGALAAAPPEARSHARRPHVRRSRHGCVQRL